MNVTVVSSISTISFKKLTSSSCAMSSMLSTGIITLGTIGQTSF